jgi:hypothetical protein
MTVDEKLDDQLIQLGNAVAPRRSIVAEVMRRTAGRSIGATRRHSFAKWCLTALRPPQLAAGAVAALLAVYVLVFHQPSVSVFADQALAALEEARANGVTVEERTEIVMRDGSRQSSSTRDTFFVGRDSYRRNIYDGDHLREIQWYTPDGDGMRQTSIQFDAKTYSQEKHLGKFGDEDPVERMRFLIRFIVDADRELQPRMIKGRQRRGFEISARKYGDNPEGWIDRVWIDSATKLPVCIEQERPRSEKEFKAFITVQERFDWHPDLLADTFTPKIPDGFTIRKQGPNVASVFITAAEAKETDPCNILPPLSDWRL